MPQFSNLWKSYASSWRHHAGVQIATHSVLSATFTVVVVFLSLSMNARRVIVNWGENVQMTAYLQNEVASSRVSDIESALTEMGDFVSVKYVSKSDARSAFEADMASYAPDLLDDPEFENTIPASFLLSVGSGDVVKKLKDAAEKVKNIEGIEEVSYGQEWAENYAGLVRAFSQSGWFIAFILIAGSFLVIGNSIRAAVSQRRDEIEIMELVGATRSMIRAPFVFEGAVMGGFCALLALWFGYLLHVWMREIIGSDLAFLRLTDQFQYFGLGTALLIVVIGALSGAIGSYMSVRRLNDGWAASEGSKR